jgi:hypothetical protein
MWFWKKRGELQKYAATGAADSGTNIEDLVSDSEVLIMLVREMETLGLIKFDIPPEALKEAA